MKEKDGGPAFSCVDQLSPEDVSTCGICGLPTIVSLCAYYCETCKALLCATCRYEGHGCTCRDAADLLRAREAEHG